MTPRSLPSRFLVIITVLAAVVAGCSPSSEAPITTAGGVTTTTTAPTTTTATPATAPVTTIDDRLTGLAATVCADFDTTPFPARRAILNQQADDNGTTPDELLQSMDTACSDTASTFEDLEKITNRSDQLRDDGDRFLLNDFVLGCDAALTGTITNGYTFNVGVVAALYRGADAGDIDATALVVVPLLEPGETVSINRELGSSPDLQCGLSARAFIASSSVATDTWQPAADARALPATTGDDWLAIMQAVIAAEEATTSQGLFDEFGMTEDVRSAEYPRLVAGAIGNETAPATEVTEICDATELTTDLVNVTYVATSGTDTYTGSGLFRRSPQDGRWRWLQRSFYLGEGNACSKLDGVFLQLMGQQA